MLNLKKAAAVLAAVVIAGFSASAADVTVKMNGVGGSEYMDFSSGSPIMHNDTLFVPARALADSAGMNVAWDQTTETAIFSVDVRYGADTPLKAYCTEMINKVPVYGLAVTPKSASIALTAGNTNAVLRFIFEDADGSDIAVGKNVGLSVAPEVVNDSTLMIPLREAVSAFGLQVGWSQDDLAVEISIPEHAVVPVGTRIMPVHTPRPVVKPVVQEPVVTYEEVVEESAPVEENKGTYLGRFKITHYCPCNQCNGSWGNHTAYADEIKPGQTIAVDPKVIAPLSWVYVDGYGLRRAEDCGGAVKGNHIDMAIRYHGDAYEVVYRDVWLQN